MDGLSNTNQHMADQIIWKNCVSSGLGTILVTRISSAAGQLRGGRQEHLRRLRLSRSPRVWSAGHPTSPRVPPPSGDIVAASASFRSPRTGLLTVRDNKTTSRLVSRPALLAASFAYKCEKKNFETAESHVPSTRSSCAIVHGLLMHFFPKLFSFS